MILGDAEFLLGADHRVGLDAANGGALERCELQAVGMAVVQRGTLFGIRHLEGRRELACAFEVEDIWRAGEDRVLLLAIKEIQQSQPVCVRMGHDLTNLGDDDLLAIPAEAAGLELAGLPGLTLWKRQAGVRDLTDLQAGQGQLAGDVLDGEALEVDEVLQP